MQTDTVDRPGLRALGDDPNDVIPDITAVATQIFVSGLSEGWASLTVHEAVAMAAALCGAASSPETVNLYASARQRSPWGSVNSEILDQVLDIAAEGATTRDGIAGRAAERASARVRQALAGAPRKTPTT